MSPQTDAAALAASEPTCPASLPAAAHPHSTGPSPPRLRQASASAHLRRRSQFPPAWLAAHAAAPRLQNRYSPATPVRNSPHPPRETAPTRKTPLCPESAPAETLPRALDIQP